MKGNVADQPEDLDSRVKGSGAGREGNQLNRWSAAACSSCSSASNRPTHHIVVHSANCEQANCGMTTILHFYYMYNLKCHWYCKE